MKPIALAHKHAAEAVWNEYKRLLQAGDIDVADEIRNIAYQLGKKADDYCRHVKVDDRKPLSPKLATQIKRIARLSQVAHV